MLSMLKISWNMLAYVHVECECQIAPDLNKDGCTCRAGDVECDLIALLVHVWSLFPPKMSLSVV